MRKVCIDDMFFSCPIGDNLSGMSAWIPSWFGAQDEGVHLHSRGLDMSERRSG